ncbi:MAG: hypothetical protein R3F02_02100 [Thiolinea sp.]
MGNMRPPVIEDNERVYMSAIRKRWFCHFFEQLPARIRSEKKTSTQVALLKHLVNGYQESKELSFYIEEGKDTSDDKNVFTYGKDLKAFERQMFGYVQQMTLEGINVHEIYKRNNMGAEAYEAMKKKEQEQRIADLKEQELEERIKNLQAQKLQTEGVSRHERAMDKEDIKPAGNPALQREIIMEEVRRRCIPDPLSLPKGEKASIGRYLKNKYNISIAVFEDRYKELAADDLLGSEHNTIKL